MVIKKDITRRRFLTKAGLTIGAVSLTGSYKNEDIDLESHSKKLPKSRLGRTGWMVSRIGFGGGSAFFKMIQKEKDAEKILNYAIQLGINYFDTARGYGKNQKSEVRFGKYLTPNYRDKIFLISKTGSRTYDGVMNDIEASLKNLKTDYLDLYHIHALKDMDDVEKLSAIDGGFKAFVKLKSEGVIKNIGFSYHADWNEGIRKAIEEFDPDVIMAALNALKEGKRFGNGNEKYLLPFALKRDIGIVAMKVTGQNALIGKVSGKDLVHYSLSLPGVAVANVGIDGFATLESCVNVAKAPLLSEEERNKLQIKLYGDSNKEKLGYLEPGYIDGTRFA
ncbi:MAG: aldo/keto reductase [Melioribacteraceae bacterium]|nr:aldo/keto reductase [Melioribacteraceae bacterium]